VASADLLLHPVRLRIMQAFLGDRELTTSQLGAELSDVPGPSLYRHVARLVAADVVEVVSEKRVRGAVERTYRLRLSKARITPEELAAMTADDHRQAMLAFVAGLLGAFDRYVDTGGDVDLPRDGVSYSMSGFWLDPDEYAEMLRQLNDILIDRLENTPRPGRTFRTLHAVWIPDTPAKEETA
jgi:DNA-binding transcriptional ArsR family regulator